MVDTIFVPVVPTGWTDISTGAGVTGYITNRGDNDVLIVQADAPPATTLTKGHRLRPSQNLSYSITAPEVVYARAVNANSEVVVTPGLI